MRYTGLPLFFLINLAVFNFSITATEAASSAAEIPEFNRVYAESGIDSHELDRRKHIFQSTGRPTVLVIDDETDVFHPDLFYRLSAKNFGLLPVNFFGGLRILREMIDHQDQKSQQYLSHGTMTSSISLGEFEEYALMIVPKIISRIDNERDIFSRIKKMVLDNGIRFANMSFDVSGVQEDPSEIPLPGDEAVDMRPAVVGLIRETPQTLYTVVASNEGNGFGVGINLDDRKYSPVMPAMAQAPNAIVVGALDTGALHPEEFHTYKKAVFSNYSTTYVDIMAPGQGVCAAKTGGGSICANGTSFAAPYLLNQGVLRVHRTNPSLNPVQIKEVIMKTAYVPKEKPFEVRSGGLLYPERAEKVAALLLTRPELSIEQAVLKIRKGEELLPGEAEAGWLQKNIWQPRDL
jgi:subtilisin family serine protease